MIYFRMQIEINGFVVEVGEDGSEEKDNVIGTKVNQALGHLNEEKFPVSAFLTMLDKEKAEVMFSKQAEDPLEQVSNKILNKIKTSLNVSGTIERVEEITTEKFRNGISESSEKGYMRGSRHTINELKLDFDDNYTFDVKEGIVPQKKISRKKALDKAFALMGDEEYRKEIDRIYSKENLKNFFCHPVHYYISAENQKSADEMTELLLQSLFNNGRLLGRRVSHALELKQNCYDERDFENMISSSQGATVVISMNVEREKDADISSDYENVINYVAKMVKKYHQNVLFVFQEIIEGTSFGKHLLASLEDVRIEELCAGAGQRDQAEAMLERLIQNSKYAQFLDSCPAALLPEKTTYSAGGVYKIFDQWEQQIIYEKVYKSYGIKEKVVIEEENTNGNAYNELQELVGLREIKDLVDQIIAMNKIRKKRQEMGMDAQTNALHMIFTGNPGSAKTTVARLLARILKEEGIIQNSEIIECGRADLVGKYVGWTAVQVKRKFREAKNGVLFIDEAYSLVDDRSGSYGDEAINTIVQEMENHRSDVIVIFAGYPKKMEAFMQKNEGLRSRIAFHLDFPNYNKEELTEILELMIKQKGYECEPNALEKCQQIFEKASQEDDFGNGRFVRNLLERAIMRQSNRIMKEYIGMQINEKQISLLTADDFLEPDKVKENTDYRIGFRCA